MLPHIIYQRSLLHLQREHPTVLSSLQGLELQQLLAMQFLRSLYFNQKSKNQLTIDYYCEVLLIIMTCAL